MDISELIEWLSERRGEVCLPPMGDLIRAAYGDREADEYLARRRMVADACRAKRDLGLRGENLKKSFFRDVWPEILLELNRGRANQ